MAGMNFQTRSRASASYLFLIL
ncbi:hypothetical protein [uncultured Robinsoniella sp.]